MNRARSGYIVWACHEMGLLTKKLTLDEAEAYFWNISSTWQSQRYLTYSPLIVGYGRPPDFIHRMSALSPNYTQIRLRPDIQCFRSRMRKLNL